MLQSFVILELASTHRLDALYSEGAITMMEIDLKVSETGRYCETRGKRGGRTRADDIIDMPSSVATGDTAGLR